MIFKWILSGLNFLFSIFTFNFDFSFMFDLFNTVFDILKIGIELCFYFFHYPLLKAIITMLTAFFTFKITAQIFTFIKSFFLKSNNA